ncbi:hypothetical protein AVEN_178272-1 [Araneus ventricosus]|uniref:Uncharacterized protein n=1 Tax=Araneus ventricosus TaxID=182803 RepID=A0A4Y2X9W6_ARAVE|nr:hypothetical protein AVEN_97495-1 [Araneus ventricosus]GBO46452.1 hypothetical protein AVEN_254518-1 [Araneus ventricosus]GBO46455.1 hypothetical protein AVEN_178272-1 [Araneus ventricosus]
MLLQWSEEMKISWCEIWVVGKVFQCFCGRQFCTPVFLKENRVSIPVFVKLQSLSKPPLVGNEFHLGMFSLNAKTSLHFALQSPTMYSSTPPSSNRNFVSVRHN